MWPARICSWCTISCFWLWVRNLPVAFLRCVFQAAQLTSSCSVLEECYNFYGEFNQLWGMGGCVGAGRGRGRGRTTYNNVVAFYKFICVLCRLFLELAMAISCSANDFHTGSPVWYHDTISKKDRMTKWLPQQSTPYPLWSFARSLNDDSMTVQFFCDWSACTVHVHVILM